MTNEKKVDFMNEKDLEAFVEKATKGSFAKNKAVDRFSIISAGMSIMSNPKKIKVLIIAVISALGFALLGLYTFISWILNYPWGLLWTVVGIVVVLAVFNLYKKLKV